MVMHNEGVEKLVLSALLADSKSRGTIFELIKKDTIYTPKNQSVFESILEMYNKSLTISAIDLIDYMRKMGTLRHVGESYLFELNQESLVEFQQVRSYCMILKEHQIKRELMKLVQNTQARLTNEKDALEVLEFFEKEMKKVKAITSIPKLSAIMADIQGAYDELHQSKVNHTIKTRYQSIDDAIIGFNPTDYAILAGRPSMGKTAFAMNLIRAFETQNKSTLMFSIEMPKALLYRRFLSMIAHVPGWRLNRKLFETSDYSSLLDAVRQMKQWSLKIDDSGTQTIQSIRAISERQKEEQGLDVVIIDHIGLIRSGKSYSKNDELGDISRQIKQMAKELNVVVLVLSQLNRSLTTRVDKMPMLSDLRDSGNLEQDADMVIMLHTDDYYDAETAKNEVWNSKVFIAKDRNNGGTRVVNLEFLRNFSKFKEKNESIF